MLPRRPLGGRRRGHSSKGSLGCGGPSVGSTPSNRLLTDSPAWTREMASANSSATDRIFSSGQCAASGHGVGGDHLGDHRVVAQPLDGLADEQPVRAGHRRAGAAQLPQLVEQLARSCRRWRSRRRARSRACPSTSPMIASMTHPVVGEPLLAAGRDRQAEQPGERGWRVLALPRSGETTTALDRSWSRKWSASSPQRVRWSTGTEKKPCTCGECSVIVSTRLAPGGDQQVGDQPAADARSAGRPSCPSGRRRSAGSPR